MLTSIRNLALVGLVLAVSTAAADDTVDAARRLAVIETVLERIRTEYIHDDVAREIVRVVGEKHAAGGYDDLEDRRAFLAALTEDIRGVSHDFHLGVWPIEWALVGEDLTPAEQAALAARARYMNHGVRSVRVLPGNIGYFELTEWMAGDAAAGAAEAALSMLSRCEALVFDLRRNGGGEGQQGDVLYGQLFRERVHVADCYSKKDRTTEASWVEPAAVDLGLGEVPVYVLISARSASASESFAAILQSQGRGKVVGEVSRGAANPTEEYNYPELGFCMGVTSYEVRLAATGGNWEGTGVKPDIEVAAEDALAAACIAALEAMPGEGIDAEIATYRRWALDRYRAELDPVAPSDAELEALAGPFEGGYSVRIDDGRLVLVHPVKAPVTLIPLGGGEFALREEEGRLRVLDDGSLEIRFPDGFDVHVERQNRKDTE